MSDIEDHEYGEWVVTTKATTSSAGERVHICQDCGYRETESIPKLTPDPDPDPDPDPSPTPSNPTYVPPTPNPGTTIEDPEVPLANVEGLNTTDHYAYLTGYGDGTIRPERNITRAEAATIFFRLMTTEYRAANWATENDFSDVKSGDWFNNAVSTCAKAGILDGYPDGTYRPNNTITRAEFTKIASRFATLEYDGKNRFDDVADDYWAVEYINTAALCGWIDASGKNFRPTDKITRAEVAKIVNYMLDRIPDKDHLLDDMTTWTDNMDTEKWYYALIQEATNSHYYEFDEDGYTEIWTELREDPDWKALEKEGASPESGPSVDVMMPEKKEDADTAEPSKSGNEDELDIID